MKPNTDATRTPASIQGSRSGLPGLGDWWLSDSDLSIADARTPIPIRSAELTPLEVSFRRALLLLLCFPVKVMVIEKRKGGIGAAEVEEDGH